MEYLAATDYERFILFASLDKREDPVSKVDATSEVDAAPDAAGQHLTAVELRSVLYMAGIGQSSPDSESGLGFQVKLL